MEASPANQLFPPAESKLHFLDYWRIIRVRKSVVLLFFLLMVLTAAFVTYFLPETYSSTVRIEVDKDTPDVETLQGRNFSTSFDPFFVQTQFELLQSKTVLYKVIQKLTLNERWAKRFGFERLRTDETFLLLKRQMRLSQTRSTSLIEITVRVQGEENKQEAADIANEIARTYRDYRLDQRTEMTTRGIKAFRDELAVTDLSLQATQAVVEGLRKDLEVSEIDPMSGRSSGSLEDETLRRMEGMRVEAGNELVRWRELYSKLTNMTRVEFKLAAATASPDAILEDLIQRQARAESERAIMDPDFSPEHPEVQKMNKLLETLDNQINDRLTGILAGLKTKVDSYAAQLKQLDKDVTEARDKNIKNATKFRPFLQAKDDLELAKQLKNAISLRVSSEMVNLKMPYSSVVRIVDEAEPGIRPVSPNKVLNISLGVVLGLILGIGLAFFIEYLDTSVKTIDDVERTLQAPVLGVIPTNVGCLLDEGPENPHAEAYRVLRTNILFSRKEETGTTLTVVSAGAGEGKSTTLFNLAVTFAQNGNRVLVVDSDLRRPSIHKLLRISNSIGLTNYLLKQNTLEEVIQTTPLATLDFMPSGKLPSSSMGILSSPRMKELITDLKRRYDYVFFDSPPIMGVSDASVLASGVDMTLQVIQYRRYPQPMTIRAKQMIEKVGGNLLGIVLNNINMSSDASYYYYSGYYHEYYGKNDDEQIVKSGKGGGKSGRKEGEEVAAGEIKQKY
jgi:capsular exopolysaccharide synthesis family protein